MQITSGKVASAKKVLIYGPEGVGKSTLAAMFPDPLFIDVEDSTRDMDVRRLPRPESWTALLEEVRFVRVNPSECRTLIIDTADWAERLCISHVCAVHQTDSIEKILGGYGKGFTVLGEEFGNLLNELSEVVDRGVNVVLTAHANVRKFEQPDEMAAYDRWGLKLTNTKAGNGSASITKEWADAVLFATYKTFAVKNETKTAKGQGGKHVLYTSHHPAYDAKNRWGLPAEIDIEGITKLPADLAAAVPAIEKPKSIADAIAEEFAEEGGAKGPDPVPEALAQAGKPRSVADTVDMTATTVEPKATAEEAVAALAAEGLQPMQVPELPHLRKLIQLMEDNDVHESDIRAAVAAKGVYPASTPIDKYDPAYVEGVLVGAWPQVFAAINASRQAELDSVPFK
jgi:hypothetical protein